MNNYELWEACLKKQIDEGLFIIVNVKSTISKSTIVTSWKANNEKKYSRVYTNWLPMFFVTSIFASQIHAANQINLLSCQWFGKYFLIKSNEERRNYDSLCQNTWKMNEY